MITCKAVSKDCVNKASYGEICVGCNACGRRDKNTMWQARYKMYVGELAELVDKFGDDFYKSNLQQMNIAQDVISLGEYIKECVEHIDFGGMDHFEIGGEG